MNPKKGPWSASSSFFFLKYSCNSLAFCLWNSIVITPFPPTAASAAATGFGGGGAVGGGGGADGGVGFLGGVATGLLKGPSVWEQRTVSMVDLVAEDLNFEAVEEDEFDDEEEFEILIHGNDATDIFFSLILDDFFWFLFVLLDECFFVGGF